MSQYDENMQGGLLMKYHNLDSIHLSQEDYFNLFKWKENNRVLVNAFRSVLSEGVIVIEKGIFQFFKQDDIHLEIELFYGSNQAARLSFEKLGDGRMQIINKKIIEHVVNRLRYDHEKLIQDCLTLHAAMMAYMSYFMEKKIYVDKEVVQRTGSSKKKLKDKSRKKKIVKIQHRVFNVRVGENTKQIKIKREIQRTADNWTVRGHWRHLKSGRKIWVKSHKKGLGEKQEGTIYKL